MNAIVKEPELTATAGYSYCFHVLESRKAGDLPETDG
jgi:hypothetical protein